MISEEEFVNDDGILVTHRSYLKIEDAALGKSTYYRGSDSVKEEMIFHHWQTDEKRITIWVKGTFQWNSLNDTVTISNASSGYQLHNSGNLGATVVGDSEKKDSNVGGALLGNKYAFIERVITLRSSAGTDKAYRLWVDVDVKGARHVDT